MVKTVIEIIAKVADQTAAGTGTAVQNLSKIEQAGLEMQKTLTNMNKMSKIEVTTSLKDSATKGLTGIINLGKNLVGKTWSVTASVIDRATAPLKSILNMVKNPIVQTVTLMGITAGVTDTIATYASYEQSLADTKAVTGASDLEMAMIAEEAKRVAGNSTFTATGVGEVTTILGTAGWTADQIMAGTEGVVTMAQAGGVDASTAAGITTSTIAQFGLNTEDSGYVGDVLAAATSNSNTNMSGMGETFKYVGSTASALGFSLEDLAIATGLLGDTSVEGSQAGTSLRTIFTNLVDPTTAEAAAMDKLGVSLTDQHGNMNSLMDIMLQMRTGFSTLSESEKALYAATMGGSEALSAMFAIIDAGEEDFNKLTEAVYDYDGVAKQMADTRMDSLAGDFNELNSKIENVKISIGERLAPTLRSFIQMATDQVPQIGDAIDGILQDSQLRFQALLETPQWENASMAEKISLTWDTMVGDPFRAWWEETGFESAKEYGFKIGNTMGSVLSGGLMTLFGIDLGETASDGMQVGKAFVDGFMEGFDFDGVAQGLLNAFTSVAKEAAKILPGGEEATGSSWLAAGLLTYGGLKVASGVKSAWDVTSGIYSAGSSLVGAGKTALSVAPTLGKTATGALGTVGKLAKGAGLLGLSIDGIAGAFNAEEWMGANTTHNQIISGIGGAIGGTGSGFGNAVSGAVKGAAVGAIGGVPGMVIGGTIGAVGGAIGGEKLSQGLENYLETVSLACVTFWEETGREGIQKIGKFFGNIGLAFTTFWEEKYNAFTGNATKAMEFGKSALGDYFQGISDSSSYLWQATGDFFTETVPGVLALGQETISGFFVGVNDHFSALWQDTQHWFGEKKTEAFVWLSDTVYTLFTNINTSWSEFWDNTFAFFTGTVPGALKNVTSSISGFFGNVTSSISGFFSNAISNVGSYVSQGFTNLTGLSLPGYAEGGLLNAPQIALVGEDGPEAIIPLGGKRRSRGIALWQEAGKQLGIPAFANGGMVGQTLPTVPSLATEESGKNSATIQVEIGQISMPITVPSGNYNASELLEILRENIEDLAEDVAQELAKKLEQIFSNMPVLA